MQMWLQMRIFHSAQRESACCVPFRKRPADDTLRPVFPWGSCIAGGSGGLCLAPAAERAQGGGRAGSMAYPRIRVGLGYS